MHRLLLPLLFAATTLSALAAERVSGPAGKVYTYKEVDGVAREIEVYFPPHHDPSREKVPGIIFFHGGGWGGGSRDAFKYQCHYFASRGLVAATVTYQLATKESRASRKPGESRKRTGVPDAKSAIRWYKQQADELGIDPERIIAGGGSAGGHICLVATNNLGLNDPQDSKEFDASVAAYILFNPALSKSDASDPEIDVIQHLKADFPPAIAFFGTKDKWLEGWNPAYEKLKFMGNDNVDFQMAEGEGHAFFNFQPWADITLTAADRFLKKLGYLEGEPTLPAAPNGEKLIAQP